MEDIKVGYDVTTAKMLIQEVDEMVESIEKKYGVKLTVSFSKAVKVATTREVVNESARFFGMSANDIIYASRMQTLVQMRFMIWYYLRHDCDKTFVEIGNYFSKHHASIIHGINALDNRMRLEPSTLNRYLDYKEAMIEKFSYDEAGNL